jgi:AraC family transcriptional activator of tynA and feaB
MTQLETFTTAGLEPRRKIEFWNDTACTSFTPIVSDPVDIRNFNGRLTRTKFGDMRLAEVYSDAQTVRHQRSHVARTRAAMFFLQMQLEGDSINRQDGREAKLGPGDFTLCDTMRPYEMQFEESNRMFVLGIPDTLLRRHLGSPESVVAVPMSGSSGLSGLLSQFLRDFWTRCRDDFDPIVVPRISRAILDLMASAYTTLPQAQSDRSSLATSHRIRIVNYIEAHLGDPDLTPMRVAEACKMTPRYLHHLFSEEEETVARYILRRRLEECSRALTIASQRGRTVTSIAFDFGFNSPTHFGRVLASTDGTTSRAEGTLRRRSAVTGPRRESSCRARRHVNATVP